MNELIWNLCSAAVSFLQSFIFLSFLAHEKMNIWNLLWAFAFECREYCTSWNLFLHYFLFSCGMCRIWKNKFSIKPARKNKNAHDLFNANSFFLYSIFLIFNVSNAEKYNERCVERDGTCAFLPVKCRQII